MITWDEFDRVNTHPRTAPRPRRIVRRVITAPIPSIRALTEDLPCSFCNTAPFEPCRGSITPHIERQDAAHDMRDRMLGR